MTKLWYNTTSIRKVSNMNEENYFDIGGHVRMWRKERGLLQKELASSAGMNVTQLWALEKGRFSPSMRSVVRIAKALNITLADLISTPDAECASGSDRDSRIQNEPKAASSTRCIPILRSSDCFSKIDNNIMLRLSADITKARDFESSFSALVPTNLPLSLQVSTSEAGAEQLAYSLRAHLNVGAAVIHDTIPLFESYGVRVLEANIPEKPGSVSLYDQRNDNITVFISVKFSKKPWRRDFLLLSEIGRAFLFTRHGRMPYHETARSSRFVHHFAATFLQPEAAVRNAVYSLNVKPDEWTFELLLRLKERFGVSAQLFNIRLKELALISRRMHEQFDKKIRHHYASNNHAEPMARERRQGRAFDLAAMSSGQTSK